MSAFADIVSKSAIGDNQECQRAATRTHKTRIIKAKERTPFLCVSRIPRRSAVPLNPFVHPGRYSTPAETRVSTLLPTAPTAAFVRKKWADCRADLQARKPHRETIRKYKTLESQMADFAARHGLRFLDEFTLAEVSRFRSEWTDDRFRDTFAVELLLTGVPIERVSIPQEQLEADLTRAWGLDPATLPKLLKHKVHGGIRDVQVTPK
jgi:hypothetical protein